MIASWCYQFSRGKTGQPGDTWDWRKEDTMRRGAPNGLGLWMELLPGHLGMWHGLLTSEPPLPWKPFLEAVLIQQWTYRTALTQVLVLRHTDLQIPRFTENALPDLWTRMQKSPWSWEQSIHSASDKGFSDRSSPQVCFYFVVSGETGPGSTFQLRAMLTSWA